MRSEKATNKIAYIDNLRVLMTILVILHHTFISYGAPGGWYFTDPTTNKAALLIMTIFVATNQSFFMGFFFFLAALFTEPSYNKKGARKFITDRLKRLGIPLLFYSFVLGPVMNFFIYRYGRHKTATFTQYLIGYDDWIDFGVLWFVAALLLFTFIDVMIKQVKSNPSQSVIAFPNNKQLFFFAVALGIVSYLVRIFFPVGWVLHPLGFQLAHFTQYIALFFLGIVTFRNKWMEQIPSSLGKRWLVISLLLILVVLPLAMILIHGQLQTVMGGGTWQSLVVAVWEQLTGISVIIALSGIAKYKWNDTTLLLQRMSRAAFATYIFHPLIVISISLILLSWKVDPVIKLLVAAPCAVVFSFYLGWLITKLPLAKNIV